ncbi:hypothetical protein [Aureivirga marina]|uniref:hypothetical protein n=1 Tax=Aureivirga marina TaxID=1182451 RepID=UPI0018C9C353|nr:hypothetical protein [Aureivirga marina]
MLLKNSINILTNNPTLEDLLIPFLEKEKSNAIQNPSILFKELENDLIRMDIPKGILNFVRKINVESESNNLFKIKEQLKILKKIKLLKSKNQINQKIQNLIKVINQKIEEKYKISPYEKALFSLSELLFSEHSIYTPLEEFKNILTEEAFTLYISFQTIGNVNSDGWAFGIFGNMPQLVPFIPESFEKLGYSKIPQAIRETIHVFPKNTKFLFDNQEYIDVLNFIENPKRKINNPKLEKFSTEERKQFSQNYHNSLDEIEKVESEIWNQNSEWEHVFNYYNQNLKKKVWK